MSASEAHVRVVNSLIKQAGLIMSGWFSVKRGVTDHPLFKGRPERLYVWIWLLETAAWQDTRQDAGGRIVTVQRGQLLTSYRQIAEATGVGIQVIRTLFDQLGVEGAINTDTSTGRLLVTICNYEKYQSVPRVDNTPSNTPLTRSQHTKETKEQILPSEGASAPPENPSPTVVDLSSPTDLPHLSGPC